MEQVEFFLINPAYRTAKPHIAAANKLVSAFTVWVLMNHEELPDGFDISTEGWHQAEAEIEDAIAERDCIKAEQLAKRYCLHVQAYLDKWQQLVKGE